MSKEKVLTSLAESRQALLEAIAGIDEAALTQRQIEGVWTVKDLLGHIAAWEAVCVPPLQQFARLDRFEAELIWDLDGWNASQAARRRGSSLGDSLRELEETRAALAAAAEQLDEAHWQRTILFPWGAVGTRADLLGGLAVHEEEHTESIRRWRALGG